jgi:hypothetical protein
MFDINLYYVFTILTIAAGGIPKGNVTSRPHAIVADCTGYDEGGFSASIGLASFKHDFGLTASLWKDNPSGLASRTANISSFGVLGAAL